MKKYFIPVLLIIYSIAFAQAGSNGGVEKAAAKDITGQPSVFVLTKPAAAGGNWNDDVYERFALVKSESYKAAFDGVSAVQPAYRRSIGSILMKNVFWGCVTGLILGTATGFQVNDDLDGRTKTGNVLFFSAVGASMGIVTGLGVGVVKVIRQRKTATF